MKSDLNSNNNHNNKISPIRNKSFVFLLSSGVFKSIPISTCEVQSERNSFRSIWTTFTIQLTACCLKFFDMIFIAKFEDFYERWCDRMFDFMFFYFWSFHFLSD